MVMRDGKIAERGNHDELIKIENGQYKELCDAQYRFWRTPTRPCNKWQSKCRGENRPGIVVYTVIISRF